MPILSNISTRAPKEFDKEQPHRLFSGDDNFVFQFFTSYLVRLRGTVIKCLTDFVKRLDRQVIRLHLTRILTETYFHKPLFT